VDSVAVIGASLAGLSAARALRAQGFDGAITVVGAEKHRPYDRPPLSKQYLVGEIDQDALALESDDEDLQVTWRLGVAATRLDPGARTIELSDGSSITADGVVLATGSAPRRLPGRDGSAGHVLRTIEDSAALRADLRAGGHLVVIGAGFIGAEVASTARVMGLDVTVVEVAAAPLSVQLGQTLGTVVARLHADHGTRLLCGVGVAGAAEGGSGTSVTLTDGRELRADTVLVGIGASANIGWLQGSGLQLGNGVRCDAGGATSIPQVVAVGDCAAWFDPFTGVHHRVEHWTGALERPAIAVATLLAGGVHQGQVAAPPYFWSDQYGSRIQFAGLTHAGDAVTIEDGRTDGGGFLAVYRRDGEPVAVLGVDRVKLFTRWRRQLVTAASRELTSG
jgi:NADPH-dependent 2,4-dienoyl-CoA reductase/sulfur reductase-like enzyme